MVSFTERVILAFVVQDAAGRSTGGAICHRNVDTYKTFAVDKMQATTVGLQQRQHDLWLQREAVGTSQND